MFSFYFIIVMAAIIVVVDLIDYILPRWGWWRGRDPWECALEPWADRCTEITLYAALWELKTRGCPVPASLRHRDWLRIRRVIRRLGFREINICLHHPTGIDVHEQIWRRV